ncbi:MAG: thiosulfate sulfurtransferase GlpE [Methylococcales bacterium]|jgi:thiosulfate sulfurtransferase|nr:thiosulfate sulfurtransferase GlpE [Methylococcales bacterium]
MTQYKVITALEAEQLIHNENPVILDCRDTTHYRANHIENAMHLHEKLRDSLLKKGEKSRHFLIYCYHGHASEHVAEMFSDFGFEYVYSLRGGYESWKEFTTAEVTL